MEVNLSKLNRYFLFFAVLLISLFSYGQKDSINHTKSQIQFVCDNNFFLFSDKDGYYTSGIFLRYDQALKNREIDRKSTVSVELGQMIFTAHDRKILPQPTSQYPGGISEIDRPIAGYTYGKIIKNVFTNHQHLYTYGLSLGVVGEYSLGRITQEYWHELIGVKDHWNWVWDYQINNEFGANLHGAFSKSLIKASRNPLIQLTPSATLTLGTHFTDITHAAVLQIGRFKSIGESNFWNTINTITSNHTVKEFFIYYKPELKYQLYNSTIQGGLFTNDKGPITGSPEPLVFKQTVGMYLSLNRTCMAYEVTFQSKEVVDQFNNHIYAGIIAKYRF